MATFEDSGKCKGFAFIDFEDEDGPTNALKDKALRRLIKRPLRLEYGEDRSKRRVRQPNPTASSFNESSSDSAPAFNEERPASIGRERSKGFQEKQDRSFNNNKRRFNDNNNNYRDDNMASNKRLKSSIALATAPRASAAIVKSTGKKTTF
ncbi:unnamed protein product [[Candida] boidinii]|uniref:Unnamed protein product n=1 Tax=Candida boidinii TaxID=5477 RepID=A0ACB5TEF8_CANBO|nr:unnamed protein product [[Candida] boidinii]GME86950.1 unnamed protein product [[Candida] boidinii]